MPRPMSLAEYRATTKILGEKSALFEHKKEIFEAIGMGLSHNQIHHFLTSQKGLKISVRAISKWIKTHKNTKQKVQIFEPIQKLGPKQSEYSHINVQEPKVEPAEAPIQFDNLSTDPKYARIWQVAQERLQMREEALQEKYNENHDS